MSITTPKVRDIEGMIDDGQLTYVSLLDGLVSIRIDFKDDQSVTMTIMQIEE